VADRPVLPTEVSFASPVFGFHQTVRYTSSFLVGYTARNPTLPFGIGGRQVDYIRTMREIGCHRV